MTPEQIDQINHYLDIRTGMIADPYRATSDGHTEPRAADPAGRAEFFREVERHGNDRILVEQNIRLERCLAEILLELRTIRNRT